MKSSPKKDTAKEMAGRIREISVSEFFAKNRHLLGFDSPQKALLTAIREAVDNALDACEEAEILPEIQVEIKAISDTHYCIAIEDNGPGIARQHLANIFGKLLYGSKFHRLKQSRGQQGIGISAAVMYGYMTTGKPTEVMSKTGLKKPAHHLVLRMDTKKNAPEILKEEEVKTPKWEQKVSGTRVEITLEGAYKEGKHGVLSYLGQTALSNPHAQIIFLDPKGKTHTFPRLIGELPKLPAEIKPHPHGVELGNLIQMLLDTKEKTLIQFLHHSFSRVPEKTAEELILQAGLKGKKNPRDLDRAQSEHLYQALQAYPFLAPPTNCLSPMGEEAILKALYWLFVEASEWQKEAKTTEVQDTKKNKKPKQIELDFVPEKEPQEDPLKATQNLQKDEEGNVIAKDESYFVTAITRPPFVYRGNPFQVEVGLFYGKSLKADQLAQVFRYANRVPLVYQASACAMTKGVLSVDWKNYHLSQSKGALPTGPVVIMVHMASAWVPYTSESKEAIAHYAEILKEMRLALMECGRRLERYLKRKKREHEEHQKRSYIEKYLTPIGEALKDLLTLSEDEKKKSIVQLEDILEKTRGKSLAQKDAS